MDIEGLTKLGELKDKGILSEEEFEAQKQMLLNEKKPQGAAPKHTDGDLSLWQYFCDCMTKKYIVVNGRARRKEIWGFLLFDFTIQITLSIMLILWLVIADQTESLNAISHINSIQNLVKGVLTIPYVCVTVRRLHDINMSGWWILTIIVPLVAFFIPSNQKENKYGPVPAGIQ